MLTTINFCFNTKDLKFLALKWQQIHKNNIFGEKYPQYIEVFKVTEILMAEQEHQRRRKRKRSKSQVSLFAELPKNLEISGNKGYISIFKSREIKVCTQKNKINTPFLSHTTCTHMHTHNTLLPLFLTPFPTLPLSSSLLLLFLSLTWQQINKMVRWHQHGNKVML